MLSSLKLPSQLGLWAIGLICYLSLVAIHEGHLRQSYSQQVQQLPQQAEQHLQENGDTLAAVKWIVNARNTLKQQTRQQGSAVTACLAAERNVKKYRLAIGPTYTMVYQFNQKKYPEWNRSQIHEQIIKKAGQSNANISKSLKYVQMNGILVLSLLSLGFLFGLYKTEKSKRLEWASFYSAHFIGAMLGGTMLNMLMMATVAVPFGLPIQLVSWKILCTLFGVLVGSLLGRSLVRVLFIRPNSC